MFERLADLLRLSLDHIDRHEIELEQELDFVERYLQLQAMRFEDRLQRLDEPRSGCAGSVGPAVHSATARGKRGAPWSGRPLR